MADKELKGVPVAPLTGIMDTRSAPDAIPAGALRFRQNYQTVAQNKLRRGTGFAKLLTGSTYNNEDFHDQLLAITAAALRQPITLAFEAESSRKVRSLFVGTQGVIAQLDQFSGNYRILGSGYGGEPVNNGTARRFQAAQLGDYIAFTNGFDAPMYHLIELNPTVVNNQPLQTFSDFGPTILNLSRASVVWSWKNVLFFADVDMDGERFGNRIIWSDYNTPASFDPAKVGTIAGLKDLSVNEIILAGREATANTFLIYTTQGIWEMSVVGGAQSFAFRRVYNARDNEGVAVLKYPNTLVNSEEGHIYMAEDGIYSFNQYAGPPRRVEWLHRSTSVLYDNIDASVCQAHVAYSCKNEALFSVARVGAPNQLPDITLRVQLVYKVADVVDHGFTCFAAFRTYNVPTIRDFLIENGICDLATLNSDGYGYASTDEGLPNPLLSSTAPFAPQEVYTKTTKSYPGGTAVGAPKTPASVSRTSNVATMTVISHGLSSGNVVQIQGIADPSFNATAATITVVDGNTFTYPNVGPNVGTENVINPRVRKFGQPRTGIAQFNASSTAQVYLTAHGFSPGQKIRLSAIPMGSPGLNAKEGTVAAVIDANNFTYTPDGTDDTISIFPAANVLNLVPDGAIYTYDTHGFANYNLPVTLVNGEYYVWEAGANDLSLSFNGTPVTPGTVTQYTGGAVVITGNLISKFDIADLFSSTITAPPGNGNLEFNNATFASATHIFVSRLDAAGNERSPDLRNVAVGDTFQVQNDSRLETSYWLVTQVTQHNAYYDFTVTYKGDFGGSGYVNGDGISFILIKTSQPTTFVSASLFTGVPVSVRTIGNTLIPTTIERDDPDNPDVVTMGLTAHGLLPNDVVAIDGISDTSFNAYSTPVVLIQNVQDPTFSVTDANHFTYRRPGNSSSRKSVSIPTVSLLTSVNVVDEDWTQPEADSDSLCALLGSQTFDDTCRQCQGDTIFVACSSQDWCLKQLGDVFYREICLNADAVGVMTSNGYQSSLGSYTLVGYDSILRFGLLYTTAPGQPFVQADEVKIFYQNAMQNPPSTMGLRIAISSQPVDPNDPNAPGLVWYQHSQQPITSLTLRTPSQHQEKNSQPDKYSKWKIFRQGRYLAFEMKLSGTGGDAVFTSVVGDVKAMEANNI